MNLISYLSSYQFVNAVNLHNFHSIWLDNHHLLQLRKYMDCHRGSVEQLIIKNEISNKYFITKLKWKMVVNIYELKEKYGW